VDLRISTAVFNRFSSGSLSPSVRQSSLEEFGVQREASE
jgi:hypothetical protein